MFFVVRDVENDKLSLLWYWYFLQKNCLALFLSLHLGILNFFLWCLLNRRDDHCWFLQTNYTVVFLVREKWNVWRVTIGLLPAIVCSLCMSQDNMQQLLLFSCIFVHVFVNILIRVIKKTKRTVFMKKMTIAGPIFSWSPVGQLTEIFVVMNYSWIILKHFD
jgi:hypothetical protein